MSFVPGALYMFVLSDLICLMSMEYKPNSKLR